MLMLEFKSATYLCNWLGEMLTRMIGTRVPLVPNALCYRST